MFFTAMRTDRETIIDRLLLLYSVERANAYGQMDIFKLQKIPFASELNMHADRTKGLNYTFFKWAHGPMTKEIYEDGGILHSAGLITTLKEPIRLADRGAQVLDSLRSLCKENEPILGYIDAAAQKYAPLSFIEVKKDIYRLTVEWNGEQWEVGKIPPCADVLVKLDEEKAIRRFVLDDDWVDSLWGTFSYTEEQAKKLRIAHKVAS